MTSLATGAARPRFGLTDMLSGTGAPLLFGVRLWAVRLSRALRRVLAPARQSVLGRHLRGDRVPAAARRFAAQGLVPDDRHRDRRRDDRGADRVLSAGSDRLSRAPGPVGRSLRVRRHGAAQLRVLRGGARRLYRGDRRRRHARARPEARARRSSCLRSTAPARSASGSCAPASSSPEPISAAPGGGSRVIRRSGGRDRRPFCPHAGTGGAATAGHASRAARVRPPRHRARPDDRPSARGIESKCATTRRYCRPPSTACSARWMVGGQLRPI